LSARVISVLHVSASDSMGGAARAAYRIHRSLSQRHLEGELASRMRVIHKASGDASVIAGPPQGVGPIWSRLQPRFSATSYRNFASANRTWHSAAWPDTGLGAELNRSDADLLHLHWVGRLHRTDTLSIEEIGRLRKPLVWTLHDMWAFSGAEHYCLAPPAVDRRYQDGYLPKNRWSGDRGPDLDRWAWERKRRCWRRPMQIVCPSRWLADCVSGSALMARWPVQVIPNPLDLEAFAPAPQDQARALLGWPHDHCVILFGAMSGMADPLKGADLLLAALHHLAEVYGHAPARPILLVVFGGSGAAPKADPPFPVRCTGHLHDDLSLRLHYAAADVMVVPSRLDNLPNTALEAQGCGTPVVAFGTSGLVDVVADRFSGALAEPFDPGSLAAAICWVLEDPERRRRLGEQARQRAERLWAPGVVAEQYAQLYRRVLA
jgi:glycosyltransferase involved in cell wall biosynthesis